MDLVPGDVIARRQAAKSPELPAGSQRSSVDTEHCNHNPARIPRSAMRVVFLDVDGVLVTSRTEHILISRFTAFDADAVREMNRLTETTGAKFVLSSSWRRSERVPSMQRYMRSQGIAGELIDFTGIRRDSDRRLEILEWLDRQPEHPDFIIVDDEYEFLELEARRIRTHMTTGFTAEHCDRAIELFHSRSGMTKDGRTA